MRIPKKVSWLLAGILPVLAFNLAAEDSDSSELPFPHQRSQAAQPEESQAEAADVPSASDSTPPPKANKSSKKLPDSEVDSRKTKAISKWIMDLKDPDPKIRQTACEMMAILSPPEAIAPLIDVLRPSRNEPLMVLLTAHGALVKITGRNFGYKAYDQWQSWWLKNKNQFMQQSHMGPDDKHKIGAKAANTLGLEYMKIGEFHLAQAKYLEAVTFDPTVPDYRNNLGLSLMEQARYVDAMTTFEETIGLDPSLPQPYMNIGRCYSSMNKTIEAHVWFKKAVEHDKEGRLWDLSWAIGKEYMKHGEYTMAYEYLDQARCKMEKLNIHDPRLHNDLALCHYGLDQFHSAWKELVNVRTLGFEPNPDFVAKVRKTLKDQGVDPDLEDKIAHAVQHKETQARGEKTP